MELQWEGLIVNFTGGNFWDNIAERLSRNAACHVIGPDWWLIPITIYNNQWPYRYTFYVRLRNCDWVSVNEIVLLCYVHKSFSYVISLSHERSVFICHTWTCILSVWMSKCLWWNILLTNIACLVNIITVHGSGQIAMKFGLVLSLLLKTGVSFSVHDNLGVAFWWLWCLLHVGLGLVLFWTSYHSDVGLVQIMLHLWRSLMMEHLWKASWMPLNSK